METSERKETIKREWLDELLRDCHKPEDLLGEQGLLKRLTKALVEREDPEGQEW